MPSSSETTFLAPGKLVLAGEYAVVDGSPAIVMAIDRGVGCIKKSGQGISTPSGDKRFVLPALKDSLNQHHFYFFNWNPVTEIPSDQKPGFGGSAAACVASCAAAGHTLSNAYNIHKKVQGSGSGIDIAAAIHGGIIHFQNTAQLPKIETCHLPKETLPIVIWSGQAAKTGPRVQKYLSWNQRSTFVKETEQLLNTFLLKPIETTRQLHRLLCSMSTNTDIQYETPQMKHIVEIAERNGGAAKASGAGGGDCMIAFIPPNQRPNFISELNQSGYINIEYNIARGIKASVSHSKPLSIKSSHE
ncbi:MAG: hypothetical protein CMK59_06605 [Proteobacteria bacterium]|nr:hypothetical protein [Pseudomonadota bacterium]